MAILFLMIIFIGIYLIFKYCKPKNDNVNELLTTDMEIYIANLEVKPSSNKDIKKVAQYLENTIGLNEKVLAIECARGILGTVFAIVTDNRVIFENKSNGVEIITPMEKVTSVIQNGTIANVNGNWINLQSVDKASKIVEVINKQIASVKTVGQTIKIENKVVTEETIVSQLQRLSDLHKAKILTDYEYSMKKQELLEKMK